MARKISKKLVFETGIITVIIFMAGLLLGIKLSTTSANYLEGLVSDLSTSIENVELQFLFLDTLSENASCNYFFTQANMLAEKSSELGSKLDKYEGAQTLEEKPVLALKQEYTLILIRNWLTLEKIKQKCNGMYSTVLYFYKKDCVQCLDQGTVLTFLKSKAPSDIMVFAIDGGLQMPIIKAIELSYSITEYPSLVINGETLAGFSPLDYLKAKFCSINPNSTLC